MSGAGIEVCSARNLNRAWIFGRYRRLGELVLGYSRSARIWSFRDTATIARGSFENQRTWKVQS